MVLWSVVSDYEFLGSFAMSDSALVSWVFQVTLQLSSWPCPGSYVFSYSCLWCCLGCSVRSGSPCLRSQLVGAAYGAVGAARQDKDYGAVHDK